MINRFEVAKHFITGIIDDTFTSDRDLDKIGAEEKLDGIYVARSSVDGSHLATLLAPHGRNTHTHVHHPLSPCYHRSPPPPPLQ